MTESNNTSKDTWHELSDRLEALGLKLKLHHEQTGGGPDLSDALIKLGKGVEDAFEAAGNAVKDEAVREDAREVGRLFASAVADTLSKVADDVRDAMKRH